MDEKSRESLRHIRVLINDLEQLIPQSIDSGSVTPAERIPIKTELLMGVYSCRIYELSLSAYNLFQDSRHLPAIIMIRAIMETTGMLNWLRKKIHYIVNHDELGSMDNFLMRMIFGSRLNPGLKKSYNILDGIDKINKETPGFRKAYDILCEYTHPNSAGTYFSYVTRDDENGKFHLRFNSHHNPVDIGLGTLNSCLEIAIFSLKHINDNFKTFIEICENTIEAQSDTEDK